MIWPKKLDSYITLGRKVLQKINIQVYYSPICKFQSKCSAVNMTPRAVFTTQPFVTCDLAKKLESYITPGWKVLPRTNTLVYFADS
jgi:hypothetical protein